MVHLEHLRGDLVRVRLAEPRLEPLADLVEVDAAAVLRELLQLEGVRDI